MSNNDSRGRLQNDRRQLRSASSDRSRVGARGNSPSSDNGGVRGSSSIPARSKSRERPPAGPRPSSEQRDRPPRALQLLMSAQEQLQALSKLTVNHQNSSQTRHAQHSRSRSSTPVERAPKDILPDKTRFHCLREMTGLLKRNCVLTTNVGQAKTSFSNPRVPVKPLHPEPSNFPDIRELVNKIQMSNRITPAPSKQINSKPSTPTRQSLGDRQFEYIHEILKKSSALTKATPPGTPNKPDTPGRAPPNVKNEFMNKISEILRESTMAEPTLKSGSTSSSLNRHTRKTHERDFRVIQNKITEQLLRAGTPEPVLPAPKDEIVMKMEQEVKCLQNELELVQAERKGLALQKKLLNCMAENSMGSQNQQPCQTEGRPECPQKQPSCNKPLVILRKPQQENLSSVELQLNSLREQYRKLQEDYNSKVEEVSMVRVEYEAAKRDARALLEKCREAEARVDDLLDRLRVIEMEKTKMAGSKDQMLELEQQLILAKQRYREGQEELEEIKTTMQDQMLQLEEYRNKYLTAQQTVEEQRRQIDIMELENNRISEQVNLEIQRVKNQFQEKLQELTPLPDMLKATQLKLQECDQLRQLAERNVEQLLNQTDEMREQNKKLETELDELRKHTAANTAENNNLASSLTTGEKKIEEIKSENNKLRATVARLEEVALNNDRRLDEKTHEVLQLQTQLETLREESARQVSRTKDRCESIRRTLQSQISQLECQLAQSRAAARTAQKDRDEIRQRMQAQITSLNDNFEQAQLRIRSLQSHVNYLKSSYTNIFCPEQNTPCGPKPIDGLSTC